MGEGFDLSAGLHDFSGSAPLFPLPNLVLFPHILQPLHIFEPRYRRMVADALKGERLIAMALLKPGWEQCETDSPAIHPTVCLGRITGEQPLEDGKYNLILQGLHRAVVVEEEESDLPYRIARLKIQADRDPPAESEREAERRAALLLTTLPLLARSQSFENELKHVLAGDISLSVLSDVIAYALRLEPEVAQRLLTELNPQRRCDLLLQLLRQKAGEESQHDATRSFPPKFSAN